MSDKPPAWVRDPYIAGGFDPEGIVRAASHGLRLPASITVSAATGSPGNPSSASRVQALRAEVDGALLQRHKSAADALKAASTAAGALRALVRAAAASRGGSDASDAGLDGDIARVYGDGGAAPDADVDLSAAAAALIEATAAGLGPGARLDELLLAARALLLAPPTDAALPGSAGDALRAGAARLRVLAPSALALELQRDSGLAMRRILHHGLRAGPVASAAQIDPLLREARRSADGFCTIGVFGAPVRAGAWFFEATVLAKEVGQVRLRGAWKPHSRPPPRRPTPPRVVSRSAGARRRRRSTRAAARASATTRTPGAGETRGRRRARRGPLQLPAPAPRCLQVRQPPREVPHAARPPALVLLLLVVYLCRPDVGPLPRARPLRQARRRQDPAVGEERRRRRAPRPRLGRAPLLAQRRRLRGRVRRHREGRGQR